MARRRSIILAIRYQTSEQTVNEGFGTTDLADSRRYLKRPMDGGRDYVNTAIRGSDCTENVGEKVAYIRSQTFRRM
jgi:hypothetical protein